MSPPLIQSRSLAPLCLAVCSSAVVGRRVVLATDAFHDCIHSGMENKAAGQQSRRFTRPQRTCRWLAAFSLVELLVVMAIGLALMIFAAPQFLSTGARARQSARDMLKGEFARARAHAIANAKDTAVVFAGYSNDSDLAGRAIGIVEVAPDPDKPGFHMADTTTGEGLIERWQLLPTTVRLLPASTIGSQKPTLMEQVNLLSVSYGRRTVSGAYVIFSPTGAISYPPTDSPLTIALGLATLTNNTVYLKDSKNSGQAFDLFSIQRLTGRLRAADLP